MPRVLLLHTEAPLFELLKSKLEQGGFEVLESTDNTDTSPDLIIIGKHSPDNPDFALPNEGTTPVILLSSGDSEDLSDKDLGELSQLKMPFRPSDLVELARKTVTTS
jgi:DNA-binding response OmpR family regulator